MSTKNQKTLLIAAMVILGVTTLGLFALSYLVDHMSKINPPTIATMPPAAMQQDTAGRDAMPDAEMPDFPFDPQAPHMKDDHMRKRPRTMREPPPNGAYRRIRNGKDNPSLKRKSADPKDLQNSKNPNNKAPYPQYPPQNMPPVQIPQGVDLDPKEREMIEQELERRRQMFFENNGGPPPDYYPPPLPPGYEEQFQDGYDNGIEDSYEYENNYDYYNGYDDLEGKREEQNTDSKDVKLVGEAKTDLVDYEEDTYEFEDDYLYEYEE